MTWVLSVDGQVGVNGTVRALAGKYLEPGGCRFHGGEVAGDNLVVVVVAEEREVVECLAEEIAAVTRQGVRVREAGR